MRKSIIVTWRIGIIQKTNDPDFTSISIVANTSFHHKLSVWNETMVLFVALTYMIEGRIAIERMVI